MSLKTLLLQLLSVLPTGEPSVEVAVLVRAGAVFGFEAGAVRVTLSRLSASGLVEAAGRGRWRLTSAAAGMAGRVGGWRDLERRVGPWSGGWVGVATGGLGRVDRGAVRRRDRALSLHGFRELRPGLEIRPDNRVEGLPELRSGLVEVGLDPEAPVFALGYLGPHQEAAMGCWDPDELDRVYAHARLGMRDALRAGPLEDVARAMFLAGSAVLRVLAFDPLLPEEIADPAGRRALVDEMISFDDQGRELWRRVLTHQEVA